jgi:hypothetical protein
MTSDDEERAARIDKMLREQHAASDLHRTHPSPSRKPENLLVTVERLRQRGEAFHHAVEEDLRANRTIIEELHVRQAKRRRHGRRMD